MKYTYVLLALLFYSNGIMAQQQQPVRSYSKNSRNVKKGKYSMDQFIGSWQETARMQSRSNEKVAVADTLFIQFYKEGIADIKDGSNSMVITGTTELYTDDYITTSSNDFKIISVTPDLIVLDDLLGFLRSMSRIKVLAREVSKSTPVVNTDTVVQDKIDLSETGLIKDWFNYRTAALPGTVKSETALIKNLKILDKPAENSFNGEIKFTRYGKVMMQACTLTFTGKMVTIVTEGYTWNIEVYKADGQEMVLGKKGELVYYFKNVD